MQADRDPREDEEVVMSDDEPSSVRHEGSDEEGEDLMDNMEAWVYTHLEGIALAKLDLLGSFVIPFSCFCKR